MGVFLKRNNWYYDFCYEGIRYREKVGPSKKLAEAVLRKKQVEIAENRFLNVKERKKVSFESLANDFINNYSKLNKRSSWRDVYSIKVLGALFNGKYIDEITPKLVEQYKAERMKLVKPATINKEVATLKSMFNRAIEWKMIEVNPVAKVKLFRANNERLRFLKKEEFFKLLNTCTPYMRNIVILALNTGMRRGEIMNLKWEDIDFDNRCIRITEQKNGNKSYQQMTESAIQALLSIKRHPTSPYVFYMKDGRAHDFRTMYEATVRRAGIKDLHFHDLRHTYASYLAMSGVDITTIMRLMRHKSYAMTLRYAHLSNGHMAQAVSKLASHFDTQAPPATLPDLQSNQALLISP